MERGISIDSAKLKRQREAKAWTQDELANRALISKRTIEMIEESRFGFKCVYARNARTLAEKLGVPLDELVWHPQEPAASEQEPPMFASDVKLERREELRTDVVFLSVSVCSEGAQTDPIVFCCKSARLRLDLQGILSQRDPAFQPSDYVAVKVELGTGSEPVIGFGPKPPSKVISGKISGAFMVSPQAAQAIVNLTIEAQQLAPTSGRATTTARRKLAELWADKLPSHRRRYVFEVPS